MAGLAAMTRRDTPQIATMTELRGPQKVYDRAKGQPAASMEETDACLEPSRGRLPPVQDCPAVG
jgi:hypothetical protein